MPKHLRFNSSSVALKLSATWIALLLFWGACYRVAAQSGNQFTKTLVSGGWRITGYTGTACDIVIPSTIEGVQVIEVGGGAFKGKTCLRSVSLPSGLRVIGQQAFETCSSLTRVDIPDSLTTITNLAFAYCTNLTRIDLPPNVSSFDATTFLFCTALTNVVLDPSNPFFSGESGAILNKARDEMVMCPAGLREFTIPRSVRTIRGNAFWASQIRRLDIPSSVNTIKDGAFASSSIEQLTLPESLTRMGKTAFADCSRLGSVTVPGSLGLVDRFAFINCIGLTNVIIQPGISGIEERAFKGCRNLRRLSLPGTLRGIGQSAFEGCVALTNIIFPASLRGMGMECFLNCTALKTAYFLGDRPGAHYDAFSGDTSLTLYHFPGARDWIPILGGAPTAVGFPPGSDPRRATAYPTFLNGFVVSATVVDPGQGYASAPQVAIVGGGGTGALATATVSGGSVTALTIVNPGKGYTNEPTVVIGAPPMSGPPARAFGISQVVNGFVVGVSLAEAGSGYTFPPAVKLLGGGGGGAVAEAVLDPSGMLGYVKVINAGKGYSSEPQVVIEPPVVPDLQQAVSAAQSVVFRNLNAAKSYELYRIMDGQLLRSGIVVGPNTTSYAGTVDGGEPARLMELPAAIRARAAPTVINGFLVGVNLFDGGTRYSQAPAIRILDTTGSGAMLVAKISLGSVSSISVENPGSNYSQNARIEIDAPTPILVAPEVQPLLKMTVENLLPYFGYQLEAAENLPQFSALEASFVANSTLRVFYQPMSTKERFFRLRYLR